MKKLFIYQNLYITNIRLMIKKKHQKKKLRELHTICNLSILHASFNAKLIQYTVGFINIMSINFHRFNSIQFSDFKK